jgi:hypothetical protein
MLSAVALIFNSAMIRSIMTFSITKENVTLSIKTYSILTLNANDEYSYAKGNLC